MLMQRGDIKDPVMQRARIITQFYFDFVYFRDQVLILFRRMLSDRSQELSGTDYLREWCELVGDGDFAKRLRSLRNGFSHGKWGFLPTYDGIYCYAEPKPPYSRCEWTNLEVGVAHLLLYGFQVVLF